MNIQERSKTMLQEAVETGNITLLNGTVRKLKNGEILMCIRFILSNGIVNEDTESTTESTNIPNEMFSATSIYEVKRYKDE